MCRRSSATNSCWPAFWNAPIHAMHGSPQRNFNRVIAIRRGRRNQRSTPARAASRALSAASHRRHPRQCGYAHQQTPRRPLRRRILAAAGLLRLGRAGEITSYFSTDEMLPACGQGIVAIETLRDAPPLAINHAPTALAAHCERGVLQKFGTLLDCYSACAVHATFDASNITIRAFFGELEGDRSIRVTRSGRDADVVIDEVYRDLVDRGAMQMVVQS